MNKNIFYFLIPFITLIIIIFTSILDEPILSMRLRLDFSDAKQIIEDRTFNKYLDKKEKLIFYFEKDMPEYKNKINKIFKEKENQEIALNMLTHIHNVNLNYIEFRIASFKDINYTIRKTLKENMLGIREFNKLKNKGYKNNILEIYLNKRKINKELFNKSLSFIETNIYYYSEKEYMK